MLCFVPAAHEYAVQMWAETIQKEKGITPVRNDYWLTLPKVPDQASLEWLAETGYKLYPDVERWEPEARLNWEIDRPAYDTLMAECGIALLSITLHSQSSISISEIRLAPDYNYEVAGVKIEDYI